jgi:hypothetical protein
MAALCREFDISRKTGYKILERYEDTGLKRLTDRSRRPYRHANQLLFQVEALTVQQKHEKPNWGAPKIMELLARRYPNVHRPTISTKEINAFTVFVRVFRENGMPSAIVVEKRGDRDVKEGNTVIVTLPAEKSFVFDQAGQRIR